MACAEISSCLEAASTAWVTGTGVRCCDIVALTCDKGALAHLLRSGQGVAAGRELPDLHSHLVFLAMAKPAGGQRSKRPAATTRSATAVLVRLATGRNWQVLRKGSFSLTRREDGCTGKGYRCRLVVSFPGRPRSPALGDLSVHKPHCFLLQEHHRALLD
jgi:hypothetical protein